MQRLRSAPDGLAPDEAAERLRLVGANQVAQRTRHTIIGEIAGRSVNPLNVLLLALAVASYFLGDQRAAIVITVMVVLSVSLGFLQEHRSNKAADDLRRMVLTKATLRRRGSGTQDHVDVPIEEIVPGDIVLLSAGDMIPADLRLISAKDLFINQSALTGEAMDATLDPQTLWSHYGWWQAVPGEASEMAANYTALAGPESDPVSGSELLRGICCRVERTLPP